MRIIRQDPDGKRFEFQNVSDAIEEIRDSEEYINQSEEMILRKLKQGRVLEANWMTYKAEDVEVGSHEMDK